jgi:hypothetical protein
MYEKARPSSAATKLFMKRAWSNKKSRASVVSCSQGWMELNGTTCGSIPRQSAARSFRTSLQNILDAEAIYVARAFA